MNLSEKSIPELVEIYNKHAEKPVKTFRSKDIAMKRVQEVTKARSAPRGGGRKTDFNMAGTKDAYEPREGTKRHRVLQMLRRKNGATLEEVMEDIKWDRRTAYEGVRLINIHCGIELTQDDKGRIHAAAG